MKINKSKADTAGARTRLSIQREEKKELEYLIQREREAGREKDSVLEYLSERGW